MTPVRRDDDYLTIAYDTQHVSLKVVGLKSCDNATRCMLTLRRRSLLPCKHRALLAP